MSELKICVYYTLTKKNIVGCIYVLDLAYKRMLYYFFSQLCFMFSRNRFYVERLVGSLVHLPLTKFLSFENCVLLLLVLLKPPFYTLHFGIEKGSNPTISPIVFSNPTDPTDLLGTGQYSGQRSCFFPHPHRGGQFQNAVFFPSFWRGQAL